jgi:SAM-dependent methyltransferase
VFKKSAQYYDALYHFKDYRHAAEQLRGLVKECAPAAQTLLDVGCGTGRHLEYLRSFYRVEGLDISPDLLGIARQRCPEVLFHEGDMTGFELQTVYDVVTCLFSSIGYVKSPQRMKAAVSAMARHLHPDGVLVLEPWFMPESYWVGRITANFVDLPDLKIAWMYVSERRDRTSVFDIHYMVGTPHGVEQFTELHEMGLFTHDEYVEAFERAALRVSYDPKGLFGRGMYIGQKAGDRALRSNEP